MTESNLKEMMIDDINEEAEEETTTAEPQAKSEWYLIDKERTFCKVWNMIITLLLIYELFVVPYILVFKEVYSWCENLTNPQEKYLTEEACSQQGGIIMKSDTLYKIELSFDIIFFIEIILNFFKRSRTEPTLMAIAQNYIGSIFFYCDVIATLPCLFMGEPIDYYYLKLGRIAHVLRIT